MQTKCCLPNFKKDKQLVEEFPHQPFVLDHIAKPNIKSGEIEEWRQSIRALSKFENVYCKISGMVTEANWTNWKQDDFIPYIDTIIECFGVDRIMFGSDWPVCNVAADYRQVLNIVENYFTSYATTEKEKIFGGNAIRFYNLNLER